jgi:hypothetical protein
MKKDLQDKLNELFALDTNGALDSILALTELPDE